VLRGCENLPRIAFFSFSPAQVFCFVSSERWSALNIGGLGLQFGDVVFHSRGERMHQRTNGESQWGVISLPPEQLAASEGPDRTKITSPPAGRVLRPSRSAALRLLRLHSRPVVSPRPDMINRDPEVARALEQELLHALSIA